MVSSKDTPHYPDSSMLHQFIISDSINTHDQFESQHFNAYGYGLRDNSNNIGVLPSFQSLGERMSRAMDLVQDPTVAERFEISHTRHLMDLLGASNQTHHQHHRLSLSLGSHMLLPTPSVQFKQRCFCSETGCPGYLYSGNEAGMLENNIREDQCSSSFSGGNFGIECIPAAVAKSRFLKPAQSLLEEVVSVCNRNMNVREERCHMEKYSRRGGLKLSSELRAELCGDGILSPDKQDLQVQIVKLLSLLEEVEEKFEKYCHQLEEVVSSFEMITGLGSAKSYTALALQAMSRHFGSLKDAIVSQIKMTNRRFSQGIPKISSGLTKLSLLDREGTSKLDSRMSLQQLGMFQSQHQIWRPLRGLPETSVAILRSWLFEHFLHPYPNESEKLMLASETCLTKNQVSNWFINARVRLWKPMIEEMYREEFADSPEDSNPSLPCSSTTRDGVADHAED